MPTRWTHVPSDIERWMVLNSLLALATAAICVALGDLRPALLVAAASLTFTYVRSSPALTGAANAVTASRIALLCLVLGLVPERGRWVAIVAFAVWTLDGLDGWLARKRGEVSEFGAHFDMESDSYAVLLLDLQLVVHHGYGVWVLIAGGLRYLYVLSRFWIGPRVVRERRSTSARWIFSLLVMSRVIACWPNVRDIAAPLVAIATCAVVVSFAPDFYALRGGHHVAPKGTG
jgi:phosphatidylglycerophosphate synthase